MFCPDEPSQQKPFPPLRANEWDCLCIFRGCFSVLFLTTGQAATAKLPDNNNLTAALDWKSGPADTAAWPTPVQPKFRGTSRTNDSGDEATGQCFYFPPILNIIEFNAEFLISTRPDLWSPTARVAKRLVYNWLCCHKQLNNDLLCIFFSKTVAILIYFS